MYPMKKKNPDFFSSCRCIHTTVWMHHMDTYKTHKKARWELHKKAKSYIGAKPHETTAVCLLTSDLKIVQDEQDMRNTAGEVKTNS